MLYLEQATLERRSALVLLQAGQVAAEGEKVIRISDCLCSGVVESGALEGECAEENVVYCVPSKRASYIALRDSSLFREEDVFCSKCL